MLHHFRMIIALAVLGCVIGLAAPAAAQVDWDKGRITAVGIGTSPMKAMSSAQRRAMALRCGTIDARRKLLETVKGVQIDSVTRVEDYMVSSDRVESRINGMLSHSQILGAREMDDGSVEVTVGMNLHGTLAELLMPMEEPGSATNAPVNTAPAQSRQVEPEPLAGEQVASLAPVDPIPAQQPSGEVSGLVVDASGLGARPAMSPRLYDEDGNEVYGARFVSREYAIQQGMAGYAKDAQSALDNPRVGRNPHSIKALRVAGKARTDLVISNEDAAVLRTLAANEDFLEKCRVMIVLD